MLRAALWALFFELLLKQGRAALYSLVTLPLVFAQCIGAVATNAITRMVYPLPLTTGEHFRNCSEPVRIFLVKLFLGNLRFWPALPAKTPGIVRRMSQTAKYKIPYWTTPKYLLRFTGAETCRFMSQLTGYTFVDVKQMEKNPNSHTLARTRTLRPTLVKQCKHMRLFALDPNK